LFWNWFENVDINALGFVIVAMFVATWVIALAIWRLGRIEERWSARLKESGAVDSRVGTWTMRSIGPRVAPAMISDDGRHDGRVDVGDLDRASRLR
jgi:hypothetical protein